MIHAITKELASRLSAAQVPAPVTYGPERGVPIVSNRNRIVVERDRKAGDECLPPVSMSKAPNAGTRSAAPMIGMRRVGCIVRVYAQSTVGGARVEDHERIADLLMDQVQIALFEIAKVRKTTLELSAARLLTAEELEMAKLETWPGVVYELQFKIDRGVYARNWDLSTLEEHTFAEGGFAGSTQVTVQGGNGAPVTACGTP